MPTIYPPAVARARKALLRGSSIRKLAAKVEVADSQIVRLLNGRGRLPSYNLIRTVARGLSYRTTDEFYAKLEALWKKSQTTKPSDEHAA